MLLRTLPKGERLALIGEWNQGYHPRTASYLADFVTQRVPGAKEKAYQELLEKAREYRDKKLAQHH